LLCPHRERAFRHSANGFPAIEMWEPVQLDSTVQVGRR
jgi:hypothetical protein